VATSNDRAVLWRLAERVMANVGWLRLCAGVYDFNCRWGERLARRRGQWDRPGRYPGGLGTWPLEVHRISADSSIVTGNVGPIGLAVDRQVTRTRAARSANRRPFLLAAAAGALLAVACLAIVLSSTGRQVWAALKSGSAGGMVATGLFILLFLLVMLYLAALSFGRPAFLARAVKSWGDVLGGSWGFDDVSPVMDWLRQRWHWPLPPDFLEAETLWAIGARGGRPLLIVVERQDWRTIVAAGEMLATSAATGRRQQLDVPTGVMSRLSIFVGDCVMRDDPATAAKVRELNGWGYGVVPTAAGVYVYSGAYERGLLPEFLLPIVDDILALTSPRGTSPIANSAEAR
jgi:hypothetical protein